MVKMQRVQTRKTEMAVFDKQVSPVRKLLITTAQIVLLLNLAACDQIQQKMGLEDPAAKEARTEAEGKAVGGACRHSGRAIEDCYAIYTWLPKAAVYTGWRDMDAYMRENKIETIEPLLPPPQSPGSSKRKKATEEAPADTKASAKETKATEKH
jgi:hypothetical protein